MQFLIWSLILLLLGLALIALELFVPSGGVIGLLAAVCLLSAVALGFFAGPLIGLGVIGGAVIAVPAIVAAGLKIWPSTPMGKRILLDLPTSEAVLPDNPHLKELKQLVGRVATAHTVMLPSGTIEVDGRQIDAIAPGMVIEPGQAVRVVEVRGTRVLVRPIDERSDPSQEEAINNPLNQPIEALGIEDFEDPRLGNQG